MADASSPLSEADAEGPGVPGEADAQPQPPRVVCLQDGSEDLPFYSLWQTQNFPSGRYFYRINGTSVPVEVDVDENGDSWVLYLNYLHQALNNSRLVSLESSFPQQSGAALGADESDTPFWGHASLDLVASLEPDQIRFRGISSNHERIIHFKTDHPGTLSYFTTGVGNTNGLNGNFESYSDHSAVLPGEANNGFSNQGERASSNFPFYRTGARHWGVRGGGGRWEVDDFGLSLFDTHHQLWVRSVATCGNGVVEGSETCDDDRDECVCCLLEEQ